MFIHKKENLTSEQRLVQSMKKTTHNTPACVTHMATVVVDLRQQLEVSLLGQIWTRRMNKPPQTMVGGFAVL